MPNNDLHDRCDHENGRNIKGTLVCIVKSAKVNTRISRHTEPSQTSKMEIFARRKISS